MKKQQGCHVCSKRNPVGIYRDKHGFTLKCCESTACHVGYTYERPFKKRDEK